MAIMKRLREINRIVVRNVVSYRNTAHRIHGVTIVNSNGEWGIISILLYLGNEVTLVYLRLILVTSIVHFWLRLQQVKIDI